MGMAIFFGLLALALSVLSLARLAVSERRRSR